MKNGLWTKIVIVIITLEILVGAIYYGYKKIVTTDSGSLSTKNKTVTTLYKKIAHEDLEILDVMENKAMLYYAYNNIENKDSISCEVINVNIEDFEVSKKEYALYDEEHKGVVIVTKEDNSEPINIKLKSARKEDNKIVLTTEVLDGIYGTVKNTYQYTFEKSGKDYYLTKKEKVRT